MRTQHDTCTCGGSKSRSCVELSATIFAVQLASPRPLHKHEADNSESVLSCSWYARLQLMWSEAQLTLRSTQTGTSHTNSSVVSHTGRVCGLRGMLHKLHCGLWLLDLSLPEESCGGGNVEFQQHIHAVKRTTRRTVRCRPAKGGSKATPVRVRVHGAELHKTGMSARK